MRDKLGMLSTDLRSDDERDKGMKTLVNATGGGNQSKYAQPAGQGLSLGHRYPPPHPTGISLEWAAIWSQWGLHTTQHCGSSHMSPHTATPHNDTRPTERQFQETGLGSHLS